MARAEAAMMSEHGNLTYSQIRADIAGALGRGG
jgi:hypothetical protein